MNKKSKDHEYVMLKGNEASNKTEVIKLTNHEKENEPFKQ